MKSRLTKQSSIFNLAYPGIQESKDNFEDYQNNSQDSLDDNKDGQDNHQDVWRDIHQDGQDSHQSS